MENVEQEIYTISGKSIMAKFVERYNKGKLFFFEERLVITDLKNKEINTIDILSFVRPVLQI